MPIVQGDRVRMGTRVGTVTYVGACFADVDFARGDWSVVPVSKLELLDPAAEALETN
jgi:hypothetical protein